MLADNIIYLKKKYPELYQAASQTKVDEESAEYKEESAKDGSSTLKYMAGNKSIYLHSKYKPKQEASAMIDRLEENEQFASNTYIIFFGIGLGYQIEEFIKRYPQNPYSIIEPSMEVMQHYLNKRKFQIIDGGNLQKVTIGIDFREILIDSLSGNKADLMVCELSAYRKIYEDLYEQLLFYIKRAIKDKRSSLKTGFAFKKRWIFNSVKNFDKVLNTPNILMGNKKTFQDKTAILVSAGPSLDFEIENLKRIKQDKLATIFSVGTSINILVHHDIYPDAMTTYDPTVNNQLVFNKINDMKIDTIPMIFGTSVGFEVPEQYKGPKYHLITSQDTVSSFFLKDKHDREIEKISDSPSIAVITFDMLVKLGFKRIILVGQNLSYINNKIYASGVTHRSSDVDKNMKLIKIKNVFGEENDTSETMLSMKRMLEMSIKNNDEVEVINTTIDGADIEGAPFQKLEDVINSKLIDKAVIIKFELNNEKEIYNPEYLSSQLSKMSQAYENYSEILKQVKILISKIKELSAPKKINETHVKMDRILKQMERNEFFKVFAFPMNRVEYTILAKEIIEIKKDKSELSIFKRILEPTENFIELLIQDTQLNEAIMHFLNQSVSDYCEGSK